MSMMGGSEGKKAKPAQEKHSISGNGLMTAADIGASDDQKRPKIVPRTKELETLDGN